MNGFNTPLASSNSLRFLGQSQVKMESAIQRLSSGLRINSAKDDSAEDKMLVDGCRTKFVSENG